jgi:hypothetical protein
MTWTDRRSGKLQPVILNLKQTARHLAYSAPRGFRMQLSRDWDVADGPDCRSLVVLGLEQGATPDELATALAAEPDEMDAELAKLTASLNTLHKAVNPKTDDDTVVKPASKPASASRARPKRRAASSRTGLARAYYVSVVSW